MFALCVPCAPLPAVSPGTGCRNALQHGMHVRVPSAHHAHCIIAVSRVLHHAAEDSPKTSNGATWWLAAHMRHQGSRMQPNAHALVHPVRRAHRAGGTL